MTEAFVEPGLFCGDISCVDNNFPNFNRNASAREDLLGQQVLLVRETIDNMKVARGLVLILFISPALGVFAGMMSQRGDVGVAVSTAIIALAAFLQGLGVWCRPEMSTMFSKSIS